jgi:hypothetical protein
MERTPVKLVSNYATAVIPNVRQDWVVGRRCSHSFRRQTRHVVDSSEGTEFNGLLSEPSLVAYCAVIPSFDRESLSAMGKECARFAVRGLGIEASGEFTYSELGAPLWSAGAGVTRDVQISISHTWRVACAASAHKELRGVGIDVERTDRNVDRIASRLSDEEKEMIRAYSFTALDLMCAKEAAGKAAGVGLAGSISRWQVRMLNGKLNVLDQDTSFSWRIHLEHREISQQPLTFAIARP